MRRRKQPIPVEDFSTAEPQDISRWVKAGRLLRICDPEKFDQILAITSRFVLLHAERSNGEHDAAFEEFKTQLAKLHPATAEAN